MSSADYNANVMARVSEMIHLVVASVEGEIGHLGPLEKGRVEAEDGYRFAGELSRKKLVTDAVAPTKNVAGGFRGTSSLMVVRFAPRVTWFKSKEPLRTDYLVPNLTKWSRKRSQRWSCDKIYYCIFLVYW